MTIGKMFALALAGVFVVIPGRPLAVRADEVKADARPAGKLIVIDHAGKEHQLKTWKFVLGTRQLSWLAPRPVEQPKKDGKPEKANAPVGPEALIFRDDNSTDLRDGILTYIFLDRIRSIEFDNDKRTITVHVAKAGDKGEADKGEEVLTGSTAYSENKVTIEAEADLGNLGVATVKFQGGVAKGIKEIRFPNPKPATPPKGRVADVTAADKAKSVHHVTDLEPLYQFSDGQRVIPILLFKKTVKIGLDKIKKLAVVEVAPKNNDGMELEVTLKDGKSHTLTLRDRTSPLDDKAALLLGLVGKVPAGYKFFPGRPHPNNTFTTIEFGDTPAEEKK
jgi:hypothetical protein